MARFTLKCLALLGGLAIGTALPALAQDSGPLLDLLVKKGIVTDQEAEDLRAALVKDFAANTSAGKLNLSSALTEFKLSGDMRMRHQMENQSLQNSIVANERTRERFRFRLNGDVKLGAVWGAGFALETGQASDSANQTFQDGFSDYNIYLAKAYISWQPSFNFIAVLGKQKNPFYTTDLVWDADIAPQGATEDYTWFFDNGATLEVRAGQLIFADNKESTRPGTLGNDLWLFDQQLVYTGKFGKDNLSSFVLAPGVMFYNKAPYSADNASINNENSFGTGGTLATTQPGDKLTVFTFAGEVNFANVHGALTSLKLYWDSAYNTQAHSRVFDPVANGGYGIAPTSLGTTIKDDPLAWLVGVGYAQGTGKVQGDWSVKLDYREIGIGSIDPNLNDSDFAFGFLNQRGFKLGTSYNLTDFTSLNVQYFTTWNMQPTLTNAIASRDGTQLLQIDLVVKF